MSAFGDALRKDFEGKRSTGQRAAKLARIYAKPEQLTDAGDDGFGKKRIIVNPPGEDPRDRAIRIAEEEAKEARRLADEAAGK